MSDYFCIMPGCTADDSKDPGLAQGYRACWSCSERLRAQIRTVETYLEQLTPLPKIGGDGGPRSRGYGSKSPAADDVIVMLDPRSAMTAVGPDDVEDPVLSVPAVLSAWVDVLWESLDVPGKQPSTRPRTIGDALTSLLVHVDWMACQDWVTDFAEEIGRVYSQVRSLVNDSPRQAFGPCLSLACEGQVRMVDVLDSELDDGQVSFRLKCSGCGRNFANSFEWLEIARAAEAA